MALGLLLLPQQRQQLAYLITLSASPCIAAQVSAASPWIGLAVLVALGSTLLLSLSPALATFCDEFA